LLVSIFLFSSGEDWWGSLADLPLWNVGILGVCGFIIAQKANKFPQVFSFLGTYFTILLMVGISHKGEVMELYQPPFVNAILFLGFIMITDPPTSPSKYSGQIWFGFVVAVLSIVWNFINGGISFLLAGLLCANLLHL
jgi:Na+-translocating ferredoxin:NAD+ oxidoreductase RnfD subunit